MEFLQKVEKRLIWIVPLVLLGLLALAALLVYDSLPPREFTILTGRQGGGYYQTALDYQKIAAELGYTINIRETSGSVETLKLLQDGEAGIGFVQGGVAIGADPVVLSTLSSVFYEPLRVFYNSRLDEGDGVVANMYKERLALGVGEAGSGSNKLAVDFLAINGLNDETADLVNLSTAEMVAGLQDGSLDAAAFVVAPTSQAVQTLLRDDNMSLLSVGRAPAFISHFPFLTSVVLPTGSIDIVKNIPDHDITLLSTVANLIIRNDFHPDLVRLMSIAIVKTHEQGGLFEDRFEFPNFLYSDLPIGKEQLAYVQRIKNGESTLDNYLPFWAAAIIDRYMLFVVPIAILFVPLLGRSSWFITYYNRRKITRWYSSIRSIDMKLPTMNLEEINQAIEQVNVIEAQIRDSVSVSEVWMPDFYSLLGHIELFQNRLEKRRDELIAAQAAADKGQAVTNSEVEEVASITAPTKKTRKPAAPKTTPPSTT